MRTKSLILICLELVLLSLLLGLGCGPKAPKVILDAEDQYALARREFDERHWDRAVVELQKLVFNYPGVSFVDSAQYLLGMTYFNQEEYPSAILEFNKLSVSYPTSELADDAALMVAQSDFEMSPKAALAQEFTQRTVDELNNFLNDYPESDRRGEALELLIKARGRLAKKAYENAHIYFRLKRYEAALIYLRKVLNDYHDTEWIKPAQFELAEVFLKQGEYGKAKEEYQKFLQDYPGDELTKKANKRLKKMQEEDSEKE